MNDFFWGGGESKEPSLIFCYLKHPDSFHFFPVIEYGEKVSSKLGKLCAFPW